MTQNSDLFRNPTPIVAIGVGNRMLKYLTYVEQHPERVQLVAIVEPDDIRRQQVADKFKLPKEACFKSYEDFFKTDSTAEAAFICTPEKDHFKPCISALKKNMHVLLEKPAAQNIDQLKEIRDLSARTGKEVIICHILRYHPCFLKIKELIKSGKYGRIVSITHTENVGIDRMCHSYVRGSMNRESDNNPMLLAKCCHDIDFLLWLSEAKCKSISSFGSRLWFRSENAPEGSASRCLNCKVEDKCPYSAIDLYWRRREWISNFIIPENQTIDEVLRHELKQGDFGRCVYHCDNDVVDNQVVTMNMDDGSIVTLHMDIFTQRDCRYTEIKLTEGEIISDGKSIHATHFATREHSTFEFPSLDRNPFHGGADLRLVEQFLNSIRGEGKIKASTTIDEAIRVHIVCQEADKSRKSGETVKISKFA